MVFLIPSKKPFTPPTTTSFHRQEQYCQSSSRITEKVVSIDIMAEKRYSSNAAMLYCLGISGSGLASLTMPLNGTRWSKMKDEDRTKEQLIDELVGLRQQVTGSEMLEIERKKAEEEIRQQNEFLNSVVEALAYPLYVIDVHDYTIKMANSAASLGGLPEDTTCYALTHKSDKPCGDMEHLCPIEEIRKTKNPVTLEHIHYDKDGNPRNVEVHGYPIFGSQGNIVQMIEYCLDITDRKQAAEALRESEEKYRGLFDESIAVVYLFDDKKNFLDSNQAGLDLLGYSREELLSMSIPDVDADPVIVLPAHEELLSGERLINYEHRLKRKDGRIVTVLNNSRPLTNDDGQVVGMQSTLIDITDRKQAEEALQENQERLAAIVDKSPIPTAVGGSEGSIISFNKALEELIGYRRAEITDVADWTNKLYADEEYREFVGKNIQQALIGEKQECTEFMIACKDGSTKMVDFHTSFFKDGLIIQMVDITDRKRMEEELLKVQKLESIGVLAGGIAHDLNNLLTAVVGNISLARLYEDPSEKNRRLAEAERASMRIKDLTQQLLTFSRGGAPIRKTASIAGLLRDSARFVLRGSNVLCEFSIADDLWIVEIDEGQMNQVISNIIINADQVMASGGTVKVSAENMTVGTEHGLPLTDGEYVKISIEDHGIGIPEAELPKIFDPFFTTKQAGSGLGLATSYSIVEKHDGHITVESGLGVGTTFHIYIPAAPEQVLTQEKREEKKPITGEGKILVMDDEKHVRDLAAEMLSSLGYRVTTAIDGAEAIELYKNSRYSGNPFDAVILDLTVPGGMGGKEAVQKLMEIAPEVKAIVSSGYSNDPVLSDFRQYGFEGAIAKPYKTRELSVLLHKAIIG